MFKKTINKINSNNKEYMNDLFSLLRQPSISASGEGIEDCAHLLKNIMNSYGIDTQLFNTAGHPIVYGEVIYPRNSFTLLIYGHYDVQPPEPLKEWDSDPFEPVIRDNRIYARGAGDNKGQFFAHLAAVKAYLETHGSLPINVKFLLEGEEEISSPNLPLFVQSHKSLLKSDLVLTADGPGHFSNLPLMLLGVRGNLKLNITIQRAKTDNHSGNQGNIVPNPVWDLIQLLATMKDNQGNILIDGFYENILPPRKDEERLIESLPFDGDSVISSTGMKSLPMDKNHYYKNLMFTPTFNIAGINSGYTGPGYKTIIPSKASVNIDARLVANQDPEFVFEKVQNHVKKHLPEAVCTLIGKVLPSRTRANHPYIAIIEESLHCVSDQDVLIQPSLGGTLPDYIWTKILGVPSILAPYANHDHKNHAANENISLTKFNNGILSTAYIIRNLGEI